MVIARLIGRPVVVVNLVLAASTRLKWGARALACRGRCPRQPYSLTPASHCLLSAGRAPADRRGAGWNTRGRVCSPTPTAYLRLKACLKTPFSVAADVSRLTSPSVFREIRADSRPLRRFLKHPLRGNRETHQAHESVCLSATGHGGETALGLVGVGSLIHECILAVRPVGEALSFRVISCVQWFLNCMDTPDQGWLHRILFLASPQFLPICFWPDGQPM